MNQSRAQIYKSEQRGIAESEVFRRFSTFNFRGYQDSSRNAFGALLVVNDETLGGGMNMVCHIEENTDVVVIPLVGGILYKDSLGNEDVIGTEEIRIFSAKKGMDYQLTNPYEKDLINYLQIRLRPAAADFGQQSMQQSFNLTTKNILTPLFVPTAFTPLLLNTTANAYGFIGIFEARKEATYTLKNAQNGLFAFVINGAFEFENRLIESRDGLALTGIQQAAFEALSENAILLIVETAS
jgi:redox-sensitive bicupin YhaK (pirin superfamily)